MKIEKLRPEGGHPVDFGAFLDVDEARHRVRVRRDALTDPRVFDLEMRYIFEGGWVYLAHESQLPKPHDFYTDWMGRQPVIVYRDGAGAIKVFLNACSHRGTTLCRTRQGNRKGFACTYHGWVFDDDGRLQFVPRREEGYPADFSLDDYPLTKVARVETYGGFVFASLNPDVAPLAEHLGDLLEVIDMLNDQASGGFEVVKGFNTCTYRGNWKLLMENGSGDGLHLPYTHKTLMQVVHRRMQDAAAAQGAGVEMVRLDKANDADNVGAIYGMGNGHTLIQSDIPNPASRPSYAHHAQYVERYGEARARWMTSKLRQVCVYPNLFIIDQLASLIRHVRPISVDRTEVRYFCIAPVGEAREHRIKRMRQFMDFFSVAGLGGPDDNHEFEQCQVGAMATGANWNDASFGHHTAFKGQDDESRAVDVRTLHGGQFGYEGNCLEQYRQWVHLMNQGQAQDLAGAGA
ncbi:MAG: Rieske 2Fe-2S domain-containing protein [Pseudomonadota bacterium]|nr:Rieske 2Fe-2S domain-containing protein [Pseudomonadota bacterium]